MSIRRPHEDDFQPMMATRSTGPMVLATFYSEIVAMNNTGSLLLNAGNLEGASASFSSALQALQKTPGPSSTYSQEGWKMEAATPPPSIVERRLAPKVECFFSSRLQEGRHNFHGLGGYQQSPSSSSINYTTSTMPHSWLFSFGGGNFVHDQPMVLYQHDVQCGDKEHSCEDKGPTSLAIVAEHRVLQIVSFCVVYNLALSTHLLAMSMLRHAEEDPRRGQEQSLLAVNATKIRTTLQQAVHLYAHAHALLTRCSVREDYCILYDLAIFNNHGHALYKLGRVDEGRRNFQILFQSIILRIKTRCGRYESWPASRHPSCRSHHHLHADNQALMLDGLLSNILFYLMGSCKNAPAA